MDKPLAEFCACRGIAAESNQPWRLIRDRVHPYQGKEQAGDPEKEHGYGKAATKNELLFRVIVDQMLKHFKEQEDKNKNS
jgi:hypothetical protein